jgi:hypothetical protein
MRRRQKLLFGTLFGALVLLGAGLSNEISAQPSDAQIKRDPRLESSASQDVLESQLHLGSLNSAAAPPLVGCRNFCRLLWVLAREKFGGAEGDRTPDLMNAIHALSQLSYGPVYLT